MKSVNEDNRHLQGQKLTNIQFYTYQLRSEKLLKVALRGVRRTRRNWRRRSSRGLKNEWKEHMAPLVLIKIDREYKSIYNITNFCGLHIEVEPLRKRNTITAIGAKHTAMCRKIAIMSTSAWNVVNRTPHICVKSQRENQQNAQNAEESHLSILIRCPKSPWNKKNEPDKKTYGSAENQNKTKQHQHWSTKKRNSTPHYVN